MKRLFAGTALVLIAAGAAQAESHMQDVSACLITKTDTNPFFVKMKEGASAKAQELGIDLKTYAGKIDGDHETQTEEPKPQHVVPGDEVIDRVLHHQRS